MLDPIQNHALRLCLGTFRTSATSLCVAANEPPLELRRTKLCLQYILKLGSNQLNLTHSVVFNVKFKSSFERKPKQIPLLSVRVSCDLKDVGFQNRNVLCSYIVSASNATCCKCFIVLTKLIYLQRFISIVFTNFGISTRITVAYTPTVLKWANE